MSDAFTDAIDDIFADGNLSVSAIYRALGTGPLTPCSIIVDLRDAGSRPDDGRPVAGQITIDVRKAEIAAPAQNDTFIFGTRTVTVMNRPMIDDENGLVWKMWAT